MTATILLIRHAAHVHLDKCLSGRMADVPLSEFGRGQALALADWLAGQRLNAVECSPLERTQDTAAAIVRGSGLDAARDVADLIEIDMGEWTGRRLDSFGSEDPDWQRWNSERATARIPGGETMAEAQARIVGHLQRAAVECAGQTVAMVTHSDMIRGAVAYILGLSLDNILRFDVEPASVTRLVIGDWGARLISLNEKAPAVAAR